MLTYIIRRILLMIPTLIGVTLVVFFIMAYAPGGFQGALDEGSQGAGVEARRIKQEMINRYGLDQPKLVQYMRWLNQVSPVGFKMSGDKKWEKELEQSLLDEVQQRDWVQSDQQASSMRDLALTIAAYAGLEPDEVLARFDAAAAEPGASFVIDEDARADADPLDSKLPTKPVGPAVELFDLIDAEPLGAEGFWQKQNETALTDAERAVNDLFTELRFSSINKSRINYGSIKLWGPDLGEDRNKRNVGKLISERLPITLLLNVITVPVIYVVSIVVGVLAARRRGGWFDVSSGVLMLVLYSVPVILAGTLLIAYTANAQYLRWFPASGVHDLRADEWPFLPYMQDGELYRGWLLDYAWHLVLPVICLTYAGFAFLTKVMRGSVLETISADFVRTARAKGVSEQHILFRHVLRNSLLPLITMAAAILPGLFVGSFVVEFIFSIQGMGLLTIEAATNKDVNIMMATTLVGAVLSLLSLLVRDVLYAIADPRVSYE